MLKYFVFILSILIEFKLFALPWQQFQFKKIPKDTSKCLFEPDDNPDVKKYGLTEYIHPDLLPAVTMDCVNDSSDGVNDPSGVWDISYNVVNKNKEYFLLDKPIMIKKLVQETGVDFSKYYTDLMGPDLIFQDGNRYGRLCFYVGLSGKDVCKVNIYVDFVDGKVTVAERANDVQPLILDSTRGLRAKTNEADEASESQLVIGKIFSGNKKEIIIPIHGFWVYKGKFTSDNKIQVTLRYDKTNKKIKKIFTFDPKQFED